MPFSIPEQLLLRPEEAAHALGIGRSKVFEMLANGELESIKLGGCRRIPRDALEAYVHAKRKEEARRHPTLGGLRGPL